MMDKDTLFNVLNNVNQWTMNCDTKASVVLGGYGVAASLLFVTDVIKDIINILKNCLCNISFWNIVYIIVFAVSCICLIIGLSFLVSVLVPRITKTKDSLMFFALVANRKGYEEYEGQACKAKDDVVITDLLNQIYAASKICTKKFKYQKLGLIFSVVGWFVMVSCIIIGYVFFIT